MLATLLISTSAIIFTAAAIANRSKLKQQIGDEYSDADSFTAALAGEALAADRCQRGEDRAWSAARHNAQRHGFALHVEEAL